MVTESMISDNTTWPVLGSPAPPISTISPDDPNPEWEMITENENETTTTAAADDNHRVVIFPSATATEAVRGSDVIRGRPRSATIGGEAVDGHTESVGGSSTSGSKLSSPRRKLRRCASTPDLMIHDNSHEIIVEDESDTEEEEDQSSGEDGELIEADEFEDEDEEALVVDGNQFEESFEVLSDRKEEAEEAEEDEPVMIDEDNSALGEEESATLVSTPSVGTASWTMASSTIPSTTTSVWGMKKSPSFKEILAKNIDIDNTNWGEDKALTEAKLRDAHRRHHLRVRTKPKFVISDGGSSKKMMKHANSTGDLTSMLTAVEEGHESNGHGRSPRRVKKQLSAMMEEEDEGADFIIGRGNGSGNSGGGGGGGGEILGDTDAMDYYHRKAQGSKSTSNKKKERPDEAKRREISMHKKEAQRKKQAESQKGGGGKSSEAAGGGGKKKKNDKGFGGKKERRRL